METVEKVVFDPFREAGLKIIYWAYFNAPLLFLRLFYLSDKKSLIIVGNKVLENNKRLGINTLEILHTEDPLEVGMFMKIYIENNMKDKDIMPFILIGENARKKARAICGPTLPENAPKDTIRHFSKDTHKKSFLEERSVDNVIHCPVYDEMRYGISAATYEALLIITVAFPELIYHFQLG